MFLNLKSAAESAAKSQKSQTLFEPIWFEWLVLLGLFIFASWLLGIQGVWQLLLTSDPTGITALILVVFSVSTLWCGARSRELNQQRALCQKATQMPPQWPIKNRVQALLVAEGWAGEYWRALSNNPHESATALDVLAEQAQGRHTTMWWVNGVQLKLGLLGKVIGFSILAMQIGHIQNFDPSQSQELLRNLTGGLGVALLTTMVGLVGNILLGLQLTRLDRFADDLVLQIQRHGLNITPQNAQPA
jgi:hypothetical protein